MSNGKIIGTSKRRTMPVITTPKRLFETEANYGTQRFNLHEIIVCKDVAFLIVFKSNSKLSLKLLDKRILDDIKRGVRHDGVRL